MKKLIRNSVFETNSSSAHSISLAGGNKQFVLETIYPDQFGRIYVTGGEFGWGWEKFNDAVTKLNYAYQDGVDAGMLAIVVKEQTGASEVVFMPVDNGYIDHESVGLARETCVDFETTKDFIFNKNSWLFIGNDNTYPDPTFFNVPEFKDNRVIMPVYKYELSIDNLGKTTKFLKRPKDEELRKAIDSLLEDALMLEDGSFIVENNIFFQLSRPRNFYTHSYYATQDYSKGYILMAKEGNAVYDIERELENDEKFKKLDWKLRAKALTKELLKRENILKKVKFTLTEIK